MLAPPPEGTFYIEDANLPIKSPAKDAPPERVALLLQDDAPEELAALKRGKVRIKLCMHAMISWHLNFQVMIILLINRHAVSMVSIVLCQLNCNLPSF